jgi:hypothetical protein
MSKDTFVFYSILVSFSNKNPALVEGTEKVSTF